MNRTRACAQEDVEAARAVVVAADEALRQSREALGLALGDPVATSVPGDLDLGAVGVGAVGVAATARDIARRRRELAFRVDQHTREGYAVVVATSLDLVTSGQALRAADINLAMLEYEYARAHTLAILSVADCTY